MMRGRDIVMRLLVVSFLLMVSFWVFSSHDFQASYFQASYERIVKHPKMQRLQRGVTASDRLRRLLPVRAARPGSAMARTLTINEVLATNRTGLRDEDSDAGDWLELANPSSQPVVLAGATLTDDRTAPAKWLLPAKVLEPGEFLLVWASGKDRSGPGEWHTNFRLSRHGGYLGLFDPDGRLVDGVTYGAQRPDVSLGRTTDASKAWVFFETPTPGTPNRAVPRAGPTAPAVTVTPTRGLYVRPVTVTLTVPVSGASLYYTLDGSDPTMAGTPYEGPIVLSQTAVLRAVARRDGVPVSQVTTESYFIDEPRGLPVLSLVTDPVHLWDEVRGIYANPTHRGRAWERPVTVQWLEPDGTLGFTVNAGLRIHGGGGRTESAKQSFRLYFRGQYGLTKLDYPLFGGSVVREFDKLVLRAGHNDSWHCFDVPACLGEAVYFRDQLVRDLHGAMRQVAAQGRWGSLYLNGKYWGLYNVTERIGEDFLESHFDQDDWDLVVPDTEGNPDENQAWADFADWITGADLSNAAQYERALQQLDIENVTSFFILRLWAGDTDWGGNWYAVRMRKGPDSRWRLFIWDAEMTFGLGQNTVATESIAFSQAVIDSGTRSSLTPILASLLNSPQYQGYFTAQVEKHLAGALATDQVRSRVAALAELLRPGIVTEAARWLPDQSPESAMAQWEAAVGRVSAALDASEKRLRELSNPETLRQLLPPPPGVDDPAPLPAETRIAFWVGYPSDLTKGDAAVVARLTARGATVDIIGTDDGSEHDPAAVAATHALVLVSSSVRSLDTAVRSTQTATPVIFWEPLLLEPARLPLSPWGGTRSQQVDIQILQTGHPITAGLPVDQPLRVVRRPDTFSVGYPTSGPGVHVLAAQVLGGDYAVLAADAGAELANGKTALARSVFLFWQHDTFRRATTASTRLFDQAVNWALGLPAMNGA